ncbi:RNA polymerase sigma-70 factor [Chitinophaga agrisoli]|uniref:RNA polymerase sigma-70 factor n=1 Tax=Chitinophaga agrisoli TaxID=2607653 RepID=A0A5B2VL05_9BACT|nr:RNA polymerase sigma-70 factor [Chitinophaga agrisoli]KAA2238972.1 RNA polymerase sigma-70 factor [Chitinophaga agrisoli]
MPEQNQETFGEIFSIHYRRLVMEAYYLLRDEQEAKDVVQEIFIELWRRQQLDEIQSIKAYLTQSVRNRCMNILKSARSREQHEIGYQYSRQADMELIRDHSEEEHTQQREQKAAHLLRAIDELPPKTAKIFQLYYIEKKSRNDVAMELGVSINTVKTVLSRALQFLRKKVL